MYAKHMKCRDCGHQVGLSLTYSCPECGGIMEIRYDYEAMKRDDRLIQSGKHTGMWRYFRMLPLAKEENVVTLGEGDTPLLRCRNMEKEYGVPCEIYIKSEHLNPSGSFKDRPSSVGISVAKEFGADKVVIASSGNAAAAASAYCARAGMECVVFVPETTDSNKVTQAAAYGAAVIPVAGNYSRSYDMALACADEFGWPNVTSTFLNPYTVEADKTAAYEIWEQLDRRMPDYVIIPIASGPLLVGMYKGFRELQLLGLADEDSPLPVMIGVQTEQCMPVTRAYLDGTDEVACWEKPIDTMAGGISDPLAGYEKDGTLTLKTALESGGMMTYLTEEEIASSTRLLEEGEGLYCEPTSAVAVGVIPKLYQEGVIKPGTRVVSMLTGHGFKYSGRKPKIREVIHGIEELRETMGII